MYSKHSKVISKTIVMLSIMLLASCASLNKSECISANWYDLGVSSALDGDRSNYVAQHTKACAKHAITPDFAEFNKGWHAGIVKFCTAQSGWRFGKSGRYYKDTCSQETEESFLSAYQLSTAIVEKKYKINQLKTQVRSLFKELPEKKLTLRQLVSKRNEGSNLRLDIQLLSLELYRLEDIARSKEFY